MPLSFMENQIFEFISNHIYLFGGWLIAGILLLLSLKKNALSAITSQQLVNFVNREEALVIDIRAHQDFAKGHITASQNITPSNLAKQTNELEKWKNKPIIVVCNTGVQANASCNQLKTLGFAQIYKLQGGIQSWKADNMPVIKS